ncbi:predicted protein, partial [Arabidopsis lyrata subsp. lyrata]
RAVYSKELMEGGSVSELHSNADQLFDTTIEELCKNLCELQSSNQSPSRQSFGSYGDESKIDSDLQHLALGEMRDIDILEDEGDDEDEVAKPISNSIKLDLEVLPKDMEKQVGKKNVNKSNVGGGGMRKEKVGTTKLRTGNEEPSSENVELSRFLLNQARNLVSSGDKYPQSS